MQMSRYSKWLNIFYTIYGITYIFILILGLSIGELIAIRTRSTFSGFILIEAYPEHGSHSTDSHQVGNNIISCLHSLDHLWKPFFILRIVSTDEFQSFKRKLINILPDFKSHTVHKLTHVCPNADWVNTHASFCSLMRTEIFSYWLPITLTPLIACHVTLCSIWLVAMLHQVLSDWLPSYIKLSMFGCKITSNPLWLIANDIKFPLIGYQITSSPLSRLPSNIKSIWLAVKLYQILSDYLPSYIKFLLIDCQIISNPFW